MQPNRMPSYCPVVLAPCIRAGLQKSTATKTEKYMINMRRETFFPFTDNVEIKPNVMLLNLQHNPDRSLQQVCPTEWRIDVQTHKGKVAYHPTASAVLVPHRWYSAGMEPMSRQAAVRTGATRAIFLDVALSPTKDTSRTFLHDQRRKTF